MQDVIINITIDFNGSRAAKSDNVKDTLDYKKITKDVIKFVEKSQFFLLEKLTASIIELIMKNKLAQKVTVRVDKPTALRFSDSVSIEMSRSREK